VVSPKTIIPSPCVGEYDDGQYSKVSACFTNSGLPFFGKSDEDKI